MAFDPKRYTLEFVLSMGVYGGVLFTSRYGLGVVEGPGVARTLLAVAPMLPVALVVFILFRHVRTMDELQRRVQFEAFSIGALLVGLASFTLAFLEDAGGPRIALIWVLPAMIACWGLMIPVVLRRYR